MPNKNNLLRMVLIVMLASSIAFNEFLIMDVAQAIGGQKTLGIMISEKMNGIFPAKKFEGNVVDLVIAHGVPAKYGAELGLSYDKVQESMNIMKQYDQSQYGKGLIKLNAENLKRYADIGTKISCEFCCSAKAITREDGTAACACGHAIAMRGLAAYLLEKHGSEYTDEQILHELAQWKGVYFPAKMVEKVTSQIASGVYTPDIAALLNNVDKSKVKENIKNAPAAPQTSNAPLPGQQGGC